MDSIIVLSKFLVPEDELSYQIIEHDELFNRDIHSVTFKWCSFSEIRFINCEVYDSDWEGCQLKNVSFQDVSMQKSDITSVIFEDCEFINIDFQGASISDVTFIHCQFERCDLNHVGMTDSSFQNCYFHHMQFLQSSSWLNSFTECKFTDFTLKGNFFYNYMHHNQYLNSVIDSVLLASNHGFNAKELDMLGIDKNNLYKDCQLYQEKKNFMAFAILKLNIEDRCYDHTISLAIQTILRQLQSGIVVRREQIEFIHRIWQRLINKNNLSLYTILYNMLQVQQFLLSDIVSPATQKAYPSMLGLYQLLTQSYQNLMLYIQKDYSANIKIEQSFIVKITYHEEPKIQMTALLEQLIHEKQIICVPPVRINTLNGSFIELIQMAQPILPYFNLVIALLGYIHTLRKDAKHNSEANTSNIYIQNNNLTTNICIINQNQDGTLVSNTSNEISPVMEQQVLNVFQVLSKHNIIDDENMYGYNTYNIKDVEFMQDNTFSNNE